jgi:tetratricopeptide (TPR) repeat protein
VGQLDSAIIARNRQISLLDRALASAKSDAGLQFHLVAAHEGLGILLTWKGQPALGIGQYRLALAQANSLIAIEPNNSMWRDVAGNVHLELAKNLVALRRNAEAAGEATAACEVAARLEAREPDVARWRSLQTMCLAMRSRLALAASANAQALNLAERSLNSARTERSGDSVSDHYTVAGAYRLLGDVRKRMGDAAGAREAWLGGFAQVQQSTSESPIEMNERAGLLRRLGRTAEADPITARLTAIGFHSATN